MRKRPHSAAAAAAAPRPLQLPANAAAAAAASALSPMPRSSLASPSAPLPLLSLRACRCSPPGSVVSFVCVLVSADPPSLIARRDGSRVCLARWLVSDPSCSYLRLNLWGAQATHAASILRVGQILLAQAFEVKAFRGVASVESKAKSSLRAMEDEDTADTADPTSSSTFVDRKKPRTAVAASLASASRPPDFRLASASLGSCALASSLSNWPEICAAADALRQWARTADGPATLGQQASSAASSSCMHAEQSASATAQQRSASLALPPLESIPSIGANEIVSVSGQLRCVRRLPSTRGAALSSTATAASASASASAASGSSSSPAHSLYCVLSSRDASGFESLVELELRGAQWGGRDRQPFWTAAQGRTVLVQHARVTWSAYAEAQSLQDTDETTIAIAEDHAAGPTTNASSADPSASSAPAPSPIEWRGHLIAIRFPLLTSELHAKLRTHSQLTVAAASSPSRLPALPAPVFSALFYSGCVVCHSPVSPDHNGVYECAPCFGAMRYSQNQARVDGAAQVAFLYRDARLTVQQAQGAVLGSAPAPSLPSAESSSSSHPSLRQHQSSVLASHSPLRDLLGNIDPQRLIDDTGRSMHPTQPPPPPEAEPEPPSDALPPLSVSIPQATAESGTDQHQRRVSRLLRLQWSRLMLMLPIAASSVDGPSSAAAPLAAPLPVSLRLCDSGRESAADLPSDAPAVASCVARAVHVGRLDTWL